MIKIAIADDHPLVINGLKDMLEGNKGIIICASYLNGEELLNGLKTKQPDVLLLDIQMPGQGGDEIAIIISKEYPEIKILTLTNFDNTLYVNNMLKNGAIGYLLKNTDQKTLIKAILSVAKGEIYLDAKMKERMEEFQKQNFRNSSTKQVLTNREKDILNLIVKGFNNSEIAKTLFLSSRTIENYRSNLYLKLEVKNTAGLIKKAIELGLYK